MYTLNTEKEYEEALAIIESLWDRDDLNEEQEILLEDVEDAVFEYEEIHYPLPIPKVKEIPNAHYLAAH